jgi:hypothetical protein
MRVVYANCFGAPPADRLISSEPSVGGDLVPDQLIDADMAQAVNKALWAMGATWCDHPAVDVSAVEAVAAILLPAARGVLEVLAVLEQITPDTLVVASPSDGGNRYRRYESLCADGAAAAARARGIPVERVEVSDARNLDLAAKYAAVRDPDYLAVAPLKARLLRHAARIALNSAARLRRSREPRVLSLQYGSVGAFARRCAAVTGPPQMRGRVDPRDVTTMLTGGEPMFLMPRGHGVSKPLPPPHADFSVAGVDLSPVVLPHLREMAERYAKWMAGRGERIQRMLRRYRVGAVLVPFDAVPDARLLVRAAQAEGVPTVVLNDGWKGDDHQIEGLTADIPLALSESMALTYLSRRTHGPLPVVTGDPRTDSLPSPSSTHSEPRPSRTILVGSFTFSPSDLNCRRGDGERFLADVLNAIAASTAASARVIVKLHPADRVAIYAPLLREHPHVEAVDIGDVTAMLHDADLYITTYSTSLLHAALIGIPFAYYRVNHQRLHAPFSHDAVMGRRTAATPRELTALLDGGFLTEPVSPSWAEYYLGPSDGRCTERVAAAVRSAAVRR